MTPKALPAVLAAALLLLAACGGDEAAPPEEGEPAEPGPTAEIVLHSFELEPATVSLDEAGTHTLRVVNAGDHAHALAISGPAVEAATATIPPGQFEDLTVMLEAGEYRLWCPVPGHVELGMEGSLTVGGGEADGGDAGY